MSVPNAQETLALFVDRLRAHSPLDAEDVQALTAMPLRETRLSAQAALIRPGQGADHAWVVVEGMVGRIAQTEGGQRQIQELFVPGEIANLGEMMTSAQHGTIEAMTRSRLVGIPHAVLRDEVAGRSAIGTALVREALLAREILAQWLLNVGRRDARTSILHFLCEMAVRHHATVRGDGRDFLLPMTQEQLGDALALTPVHVNRTLRSLREDGLVTMTRQHVVIHDWPALVAISQFDPAYLNVEIVGADVRTRPSREDDLVASAMARTRRVAG